MENNKKILLSFSFYFLTLLLIIIIGISNVFAETYDAYLFKAQLYDNNNGSLSTVSTSFGNNYWQGTIPNMTANSSGAAWGISSPIPLIANHTYTLTVNIGHEYGNTVLSTYNRIGVGSSFNEARISYQNNTNVVENLSKVQTLVYGQGLQFAFTPSINGNYIVFPFATSLSGSNVKFTLNQITLDDVGSSGVSETTINNSLNNQTNVINGAITNSQNNIINNQNSNRDAIINNQNANNDALIENDNANTDRIIDENKKNFNDCHDSVNIANITSVIAKGYTASLNDDIITINGTSSTIGDVKLYTNNSNLILQANKTYTLSFTTTGSITGTGYRVIYLILNGSRKYLGSLTNVFKYTYTPTQNETLSQILIDLNKNLTFNNYTIKVQIQEGSTATDYEKFGEEICINKLDQQTNAINGLNDNINDDNTDGATSKASEFFSDFNTNTFGLTSIITAPLNLIQSLTSKTCSPLHLPLPYLNNKYLDLPCMSTIYSEHFGTFFTLYQTITYGIIAYWVCVRIFNHVKDFKNPEHDEIEVVDL